jgi:hypothetical protein
VVRDGARFIPTNMVYVIISGVVIGGAVTFVGALIQDQEVQAKLYRKAVIQKEKVAVRDNGSVSGPNGNGAGRSGAPKEPPARALV